MSEIKNLIKLPVRVEDDGGYVFIADANNFDVCKPEASDNDSIANFIANAINNYERLEKENAELNKILDEASKQYPVIGLWCNRW